MDMDNTYAQTYALINQCHSHYSLISSVCITHIVRHMPFCKGISHIQQAVAAAAPCSARPIYFVAKGDYSP